MGLKSRVLMILGNVKYLVDAELRERIDDEQSKVLLMEDIDHIIKRLDEIQKEMRKIK